MTDTQQTTKQPPLVLLHGLGQDAASWKPVIRHLPPDTELAAPELKEYLENSAHYEQLVFGLEQALSRVEQPADLAGLSLGAVLALNHALQHPDAVRSLILVAPQVKMPRALLKIQNAAFSLMPEKMFAETGLNRMQMKTLSTSMMDLDFSKQLKNLTCPVLILVGNRDRVNHTAAKQLLSLVPQARLLILDGGHELNRDNPDQLAGMIRFFRRELLAHG